MASSTYDLTIRAGDDHTFVVTWLPDGVEADLTGATAEMKIAWVRYPSTGATKILPGSVSVATETGEITIDAAENTVTVELTDELTSQIPTAEAAYQLRVDIDGVKTTIASGRVSVLRNLIDE